MFYVDTQVGFLVDSLLVFVVSYGLFYLDSLRFFLFFLVVSKFLRSVFLVSSWKLFSLPTRGLFNVFLVFSFGDCFLVKRVPSAIVPRVPLGWSAYSTLNFNELPFHLMTKSERRFVKVLTPNPFCSPQPLFDKENFVFFLRKFFGSFLDSYCNDSLESHLFSGECYADREYSSGVTGSVRVFRLGLVRAYAMPKAGVRFAYWFGYSRERYKLSPSNFSSKLPPHDVFAGWCFRELQKSLGEDSICQATKSLWTLPHWDGSGDFVVDNCLQINVDGKQSYYWFEVHTGTKAYDETNFIKRLLTAEKKLKGRGRYVVFVPFKRERDKAMQAIKEYNSNLAKETSTPTLELKLSQVICYHDIKSLREQMGIYTHRKR